MIVPKYTREIPQRLRLEAGSCTKCGFVAFPPRRICPSCAGIKFKQISLKPEGKVITYTLIRVAAEEFALQVPYVVAIVETPEGARLTTQVVDCSPEEVAIDSEVFLMTRKIQTEGNAGIYQYGYKAILKR